MTKKLRYLCTLLLMAVAGVAWAQTTYTKVTTAPNDWSGTYVIVADESNVVFTGQSGTNSYGGYASVTISGGSVTGNYADYEVVVEKSGDYYTMKHSSSGKYLGWTSGNVLAFSTDEPSANSYKWTLSTSSILNANDNTRKLQYNSGSPRFACYTSAQKTAYLYLKESVSPTTVATTTTINASGITNTDVYTSTAAGSLTATVTETESGDAVSGAAVTWTSSKENVATIDEDGVVTLVAAGTTTITASYAGVSGEFGASSATYELTVTSSEPYTQPTVFEIGLNNTLFGTTYNGSVSNITDANPIVGTQDNVTVTYAGSGNHYVNDSQIRFYPNNKLTFEAPSGYEIKEIVFTEDGQWNATISADGGTYDSGTKTWTGSATSVLFTGSDSGQCRMSKATITLGEPSSTNPTVVIPENQLSLSYEANENGSFLLSCIGLTPNAIVPTLYSDAACENEFPTSGDDAWIVLKDPNQSYIYYSVAANNGAAERTAYLKVVVSDISSGAPISVEGVFAITQAGNPNVIDKIETITESGVNYNVQGTVVATSARAFVIGDGTGFIYYYNGSTAPSVSVGDMVKISGTTGTYGNVIQFTNTASIEEATESEYTPMTPATMTEVPDYSEGLHKSDYYQFEGMLTKNGNNYVVAVGNGQVRISYPAQTSELDALLNKTVKVNGFFAGNSNTTFTAIMESIEEVVTEDPAVTLANYNISVAAEGGDAILTVQYQNIDDIVADIQFYEEDGTTETTDAYYEEWLAAELDDDNNVSYVALANTGAERKAYFKVYALVDNDFVYSDLITITQEAKEAPNVTWDLSIDETATATDSEMSWTSDYATMLVEKAGASTNTNNYYPGTAGLTYTSTRFYKNSELTIAPMAGYKITKVEFTATTNGYANALNGSTWTNATTAAEGTTVTVTPTNGNQPLVATIGGTCGFTGVKVFYEESDVMIVTIKKDFTATTFSCPKALDFSNAEISAFIITDGEGTTEAVTKVPANEGLYITGDPGDYEIPVIAEADAVTGNLLVATAALPAATIFSGDAITYYAFGKQNGKEAFFKVPASGDGYTPSANKAVLKIETPAGGAKEMIEVNGGTTGIESIDHPQSAMDNSDAVYNLQGQRVKTVRKGVYIVGGRKVVVK